MSAQLFARNFAGCDAKLCSPFLWRLPYMGDGLSPSTSSEPEAVCKSMCLKETLGPLQRDQNGTVVVDTSERRMCRDRCATDGCGSFVCQVGWVKKNIGEMRI
jgi:hypothetical protein